MEKPVKIGLIVIIALLAAHFIVYLFHVGPAMKSIRKMEEAQRHLDSANNQMRVASQSIDSLRTDLMKFGNYVVNIQAQSELNRKEREIKEARFKTNRDNIQQQIDSLRTLVDTLHLPVITVYDSRKK
jgi:hypothetical protein